MCDMPFRMLVFRTCKLSPVVETRVLNVSLFNALDDLEKLCEEDLAEEQRVQEVWHVYGSACRCGDAEISKSETHIHERHITYVFSTPTVQSYTRRGIHSGQVSTDGV